jgi:hypothetical protein
MARHDDAVTVRGRRDNSSSLTEMGKTTVKIRRTLAAAATGLALAGAAALTPASAVSIGGIDVAVQCTDTAACNGTTQAQLTVVGGGSLSVSVPTPAVGTRVNLGSVNAGAVAATTNALGPVTVTDTRFGILNNNWVVAASASNFVLSTAGPTPALTETIPAASMGYAAGTLTKSVEPVLGTVAAAVPAVTHAAPVPVVTGVSTGANTVSWSPTMSVTVLPNQVPGTYNGTITHSVL